MRYVTKTYTEPIVYRGEFNSNNCMSCHQRTSTFDNLKVHQPVVLNLDKKSSTISCMNCHGKAHPTRAQRTPGHPDYEKLIGEVIQFEEVGDMCFEEVGDMCSIKNWIANIK